MRYDSDREEYLNQVAEEYGVDVEAVYALADALGESEDFDGLICMLEDYAGEVEGI